MAGQRGGWMQVIRCQATCRVAAVVGSSCCRGPACSMYDCLWRHLTVTATSLKLGASEHLACIPIPRKLREAVQTAGTYQPGAEEQLRRFAAAVNGNAHGGPSR